MSEEALAGKVAVITGGQGDIGGAVAAELASRGADIALLDLAASGAGDQGELPASTTRHRADVTRLKEMEAAAAAIVDAHGGIDILVNSAGIVVRRDGARIPAAEMSAQEWRLGIEVNLTGVFNAIRAMLPHMLGRGWGRIVSVSSQGGRTGGRFSSLDYGAAKAGVIGLSRTLATEVGAEGITVNCVAPGRVASGMTANPLEAEQNRSWMATLPVGRMASVGEIATAIAFFCSPEAGYITGATLDVNGGGFMS